jgi:methionyl-tRNA synthetase
MLIPFLPTVPGKMWEQLGQTDLQKQDWDKVKIWGGLAPNSKLKRGEVIFPRIDLKKYLAQEAGTTK